MPRKKLDIWTSKTYFHLIYQIIMSKNYATLIAEQLNKPTQAVNTQLQTLEEQKLLLSHREQPLNKKIFRINHSEFIKQGFGRALAKNSKELETDSKFIQIIEESIVNYYLSGNNPTLADFFIHLMKALATMHKLKGNISNQKIKRFIKNNLDKPQPIYEDRFLLMTSKLLE